ncbi:SigB/SigF/SigG family RNA polymerase sigma factor [Eubacteriaceae bacterium Marseille-Q4139]|jgi:RNA polymerase sporulation-specific sigma factor|nr:SigB/SigF/SigG family RNA polymerase sigma factor [Eubacteriaceae bacterium Marseille-Q4139]
MAETMELLQRAHDGDKEARDRLVMENIGLVWSIVKRFSGRGCETEDLFQIGSIGLLKAIDNFDLSMDVKLSTYAVPMITGEIRRFLRDDGMIKVSRPLKELAMKIYSARERMEFSLGREPTIEELAGQVGVSREEVAASLEAGAEVESLYRPVGKEDDGNGCLLDKLAEKSSENEKVLDKIVVKELLSGLGRQEQEIIIRRYFENQTQTKIAEDLHISQVQVSRLEKKILRQLREKLAGG